jgi:hypothetical protein
MAINTILRRDACGELEVVVEIPAKEPRPPPEVQHVPFYRATDEQHRTEWQNTHQHFLDNLYETVADFMGSYPRINIDYTRLRQEVWNHVFYSTQ